MKLGLPGHRATTTGACSRCSPTCANLRASTDREVRWPSSMCGGRAGRSVVGMTYTTPIRSLAGAVIAVAAARSRRGRGLCRRGRQDGDLKIFSKAAVLHLHGRRRHRVARPARPPRRSPATRSRSTRSTTAARTRSTRRSRSAPTICNAASAPAPSPTATATPRWATRCCASTGSISSARSASSRTRRSSAARRSPAARTSSSGSPAADVPCRAWR